MSADIFSGRYDIMVMRRGKRVEEAGGVSSVRFFDEGEHKHTIELEINIKGIVVLLGTKSVKSKRGVSKYLGGLVKVKEIRQ